MSSVFSLKIFCRKKIEVVEKTGKTRYKIIYLNEQGNRPSDASEKEVDKFFLPYVVTFLALTTNFHRKRKAHLKSDSVRAKIFEIAVRHNTSLPWIVNDDLVAKFNLETPEEVQEQIKKINEKKVSIFLPT
jgi:hypothetical protein